MADITITAANVQKTSSSKIKEGVAGVAVAAGQFITRDPTTRRMVLGDADAAITDIENSGVALNSAAIGQPVDFCWDGDLTVGAVLTVGRLYVVSATAGALAPIADLASGDFTTVVGIARTASVLAVHLQTAETAIA